MSCRMRRELAAARWGYFVSTTWPATRHSPSDTAQSTAVPAAQPHACGGSPSEKCAISAETKVMAKPAYAHSFTRAGKGASSATTPANFAQESSTRK